MEDEAPIHPRGWRSCTKSAVEGVTHSIEETCGALATRKRDAGSVMHAGANVGDWEFPARR